MTKKTKNRITFKCPKINKGDFAIILSLASVLISALVYLNSTRLPNLVPVARNCNGPFSMGGLFETDRLESKVIELKNFGRGTARNVTISVWPVYDKDAIVDVSPRISHIFEINGDTLIISFSQIGPNETITIRLTAKNSPLVVQLGDTLETLARRYFGNFIFGYIQTEEGDYDSFVFLDPRDFPADDKYSYLCPQ